MEIGSTLGDSKIFRKMKMKDIRFPLTMIVILLGVFVIFLSLLKDRSKITKVDPVESEQVYENCRVIWINHYQDYTNFIWITEVEFVCDGDTIKGRMSAEDARKLYLDLEKKEQLVKLTKIDNKIIYRK